MTTILCSLAAWAQFLLSLDLFPPLHIRTITVSIQGCCRTKPACGKVQSTSKAPVNAGNYSKTKPNSLTPWARGTSLKCSGSRHLERQLVGGEIPLETTLCVSGGRGMACPLPALAASQTCTAPPQGLGPTSCRQREFREPWAPGSVSSQPCQASDPVPSRTLSQVRPGPAGPASWHLWGKEARGQETGPGAWKAVASAEYGVQGEGRG